MKLPSKEQIAAFREGCYSHKKPEGNKTNSEISSSFLSID